MSTQASEESNIPIEWDIPDTEESKSVMPKIPGQRQGRRLMQDPDFLERMAPTFASEHLLAREWLTPEEDEAWQDLLEGCKRGRSCY